MKHLLPILLTLIIYSCQSPTVREPEYKELIQDPMEEPVDTSAAPTLELFGKFYNSVVDSDTVYIPSGRITLIDEAGFSHEVEYDEYGNYELTMLFDRAYTIRYSAPDYYTKFLEIDTRNIPDSIHGAGILMPTDMQLDKAENDDVEELLENNPIGKASYRKESNDLGWDFEHTDSLRRLIDTLEQFR